MKNLQRYFLKKSNDHLKLLFVLIATFFVFQSYSQSTQSPKKAEITTEEREWLTKFFTDVMLNDSAIFTLWGSKPMTTIDLYYHSDDEVMAFFEQMTEEEKKNGTIVQNYDLPENWNKWEQIRSRFPLPHYLFFRNVDAEDPKFATLYFINIKKAALVMQEHYAIFKRETGMDFHPLETVLGFEKGSAFWDKINNNSLLFGLLVGFGLDNSSTFQWKYSNNYEHQGMAFYDSLRSSSSGTNFKRKADISITRFSIPIFASFAESEDPVIEKYKKEQKEIQKIYKGHDFLDLTLQKLTS